MKQMTTIILSAIIYSQFMETIEPGSFQTNMDKIYKENGLKTVKFPKQTNVSGLKELFKDILREKTDEEESNREDEVFPKGTKEMEIESTSKRQRETLESPITVTETKKKRETTEDEHDQQTKTLKITPQEKPPIPPPTMQPAQRNKKDKKDENKESNKNQETEIAQRLRRERESGTRPRTDSQSSTASISSSSGGTGARRITSTITIIVPETEHNRRMFESGLTKENKEEIIRALLRGNGKITWDNPQIKKEVIINALSRRQISMDRIKFATANMDDYSTIKEGPSRSTH